MPSAWHTVRVFISSTFRDMHAERDHLIKVTFPALREKLLPYRVELYDIDLRWGITEDEAKNEQVIGLCLEQVDECRPFFLAFLGNRYGWVPGKVPRETQERFPFVRQFPGVSVTELELRHGVMLDPAGRHTLVLLRKDEAVASIPDATRQRDFQESDQKLQQKLASLKRELEAGPYPVQPYSAAWDPKRYDRVNRTEGKLAQLDDFGQQVENWLWEAIRKELQLPATPVEVEPLDAEADLHERFLELRTRIYVGRDDLYRELSEFALASGETPLLLSGESGLGKSAALARFVRDFRKQHPAVFVLPHFVGASPRTTSLAGMLQRLTHELRRKFDLTLPKAESPEEIIRTFIVAITSLPESAHVVLVFDALNQLDADSRAETLIWLPERLPPNVRVLCSSATGPQMPPRVLSAFGEREHVDVAIAPLNDEERRRIVKAVPKLVAKTLDDDQIDALLANPATRNPLFLMVALEELRGYGSFERLNEMVAGLPRAGDEVDSSDAGTKLFEQVFERLEQEFNQPLVSWTLRLLACSRRGLSGPELLELTRNLGEQADDLYPVLRQLRPYLYLRDGLFDFYHTSIRRAVEIRYLQWHTDEDQRDPWARWNPERQPPAGDPTEPEWETRDRLIEFFEANRLSPRSVDELPWQLSQTRSWKDLFDLLGDLTFFYKAWQAERFEVHTAWSLVKNVGALEPIDAYRDALMKAADHDGNALCSVAHFLTSSGHGKFVQQVLPRLIEHFRTAGDNVRLADCLQQASYLLFCLRDVEARNVALRMLKEVEGISRRLRDSIMLAASLGGQASILHEVRDLTRAIQLLKEQEAIYRKLDKPVHLSANLGNQALILEDVGNVVQARRLREEEEKLCRRHNDLPGLSSNLQNQASALCNIGAFEPAMRMLKEKEAICRQLNIPMGLAVALETQAWILETTGDLDGAMGSYKAAEAIWRSMNDLGLLANSLFSQSRFLTFKKSLPAEGLTLAKEALRIAKGHGLFALARQIEPFVNEIRGLLE